MTGNSHSAERVPGVEGAGPAQLRPVAAWQDWRSGVASTDFVGQASN